MEITDIRALRMTLHMLGLALATLPGSPRAADLKDGPATVAPVVGPFNYGQGRCGHLRFGYTSEEAALKDGVPRAYDVRCGYEVVEPGVWPDVSRLMLRQVCGGSRTRDPQTTHGIEIFNSKGVRLRIVTSYDGQPSCYESSEDMLNLYRMRHVACPRGYRWIDTTRPLCIRVSPPAAPRTR